MYAKVFRSMWEGSLAGTGETWAVFVFLIAHCDPEGFVDIHPRVISSLTGFPEDRVRAALSTLEGPDPDSRTDGQSGARLERLDAHRDWGWQVVNYQHYRTLKDSDTVRNQTRERVRRHREVKRSVTLGNAPKRQEEVEGEEENQSQHRRLRAPESAPSPEREGSASKDRSGTTEIAPPDLGLAEATKSPQEGKPALLGANGNVSHAEEIALRPDAPVLPTVSGKQWQPTDEQLSAWSKAFPGVRLHEAFARMKAWLLANPTRRKTERGMSRFVQAWLSREQDRPQTQLYDPYAGMRR